MHDPQRAKATLRRTALRRRAATLAQTVHQTVPRTLRRFLLWAWCGASLGLGAAAMSAGSPPTDEARFTAARERLVDAIERDVASTSHYLGTNRLDPAVVRAMRSVPREAFVPPGLRGQAYLDSPLPIGNGQTISQPYIVAVMSHLAGVEAGDRVYELGTGSGYQAAVLGAMGVEVYSVEIVPELAERAAATLARLGYDQVHVRAGDGYLGWPEAAPFDAVVVTAAHPEIPQPLIDQLAVGGRLVMPVGGMHEIQQLTVLTKQPDGSLETEELLPVRFVPITGESAR
jgi:protein-L-isoaspartate(D-aspartate) O-methyltransferase